jgi:hypothetical protein
LPKPITLKRRLQIFLKGIKQQVFLDLKDILIEKELLFRILRARGRRCHLDHQVRALLFFPKEIVGSWVIRHSLDDKYVGRNMSALIPRDVIKEQVAGHVHVRVGRVKGLKHLDQRRT